jgi:hypothetical protein
MTRLVYGVGYFGEGKYLAKERGSTVILKEYTMWTNMLARCYSERYRANPLNAERYEQCTVCEEWHNFQVFAEWCHQQPNFGRPRYSLDKDLIEFGNTVYRPEKCSIIAPKVNSIIKMVSWGKDDTVPVGVSRSKNLNGDKFQVKLGKIYGIFDTIEEAHTFYKAQKKALIVEVAEQYKDEIPDTIYQNLINYSFPDLPNTNP